MSFSTEINEKYSMYKTDLMEFNSVNSKELCDLILKNATQHELYYAILNFESVQKFESNALDQLTQLALFLKEKEGLLLLSISDEKLGSLFSQDDFIVVPSDTEAIDYTFMDQVEKEFLNQADF